MAQLKDLLVLGAARFLNIIHGDIDGNSASSDKVNHTLTITPSGGVGITFDGSSDKILSLTPASFGLDGSMRLVGESVEAAFGKDDFDDRWCILNSGSASIVPIKTWYNSSARSGTGTVTVGNTEYGYFMPHKGDVIRVDQLELVCVGVDESGVSVGSNTYAKNSHWIVLGNNEIWYTF